MYMSLKYIRRKGEHGKEKENFFFFFKILCEESHTNIFYTSFWQKSENSTQSYLSKK